MNCPIDNEFRYMSWMYGTTFATQITVAITWAFILLKSKRIQKLRFVNFLAGLMVVASIMYAAESVFGLFRDWNNLCQGFWHAPMIFTFLQCLCGLIYYWCFDIGFWLYSMKYWNTSLKIRAVVTQQPLQQQGERVGKIAAAGTIVNIIYPICLQVLLFKNLVASQNNLAPGLVMAFDVMISGIVLLRFISFFFLVNAICRIRSTLNQITYPNINLMTNHVLAFAGFLTSQVAVLVTIVTDQSQSTQTYTVGRWLFYLTMCTFYLLSTFILARSLLKIIAQTNEAGLSQTFFSQTQIAQSPAQSQEYEEEFFTCQSVLSVDRESSMTRRHNSVQHTQTQISELLSADEEDQ